MPMFARRKSIVRSLRTEKLCPHCGHTDFKAIDSRFSWLLGQKFKCTKCNGIFKKANLVRAFHKETQGNFQKGRFRKS